MANHVRKIDLKQWKSVSTKLNRDDREAITDSGNTETLADILDRPNTFKGKNKNLKQKGRKFLRKEKRQLDKKKQHVFWMKKRGLPIEDSAEKLKGKDTEKKKKKKRKKKALVEDVENKKSKLDKETMFADMEKDDKIIARMEKKLGIKKKKKLPSSFREDGLDYLLELCEPREHSSRSFNEEGETESENTKSDDEPETQPTKLEILAKKLSGSAKKSSNRQNQITEATTDSDDSLIDDSDLSLNAEVNNTDDEDGSEEEISGQGESLEDEEMQNEDRSLASHCQERNNPEKKANMEQESKSGQSESRVVESSKYVPPHLRDNADGKNNAEKMALERIKKHLKGLINRLSESNLSSISQEIESIYFKQSRNDTNSILTKLIFDACIMPTHMPEKLLMEHVMLIVILNARVGNEIGAYFLQELVEKFNDLHSDHEKYSDGKECDNVLMMVANLYNFKVIDCLLIYDLIRELVAAFTERDIEMLMLLLKNAGPEIRRDDPGSLKEIILEIQAKAASCSDLTNQSRVRFMLDVITALRNNNLKKIPQYDPSIIEHCRKIVKAIIKDKDSMSNTQLRISLKDLLKAKKKGRWWIVGSAWAGRDNDDDDHDHHDDMHKKDRLSSVPRDSKLLKIAAQQRMNTDIRKKIFCVMMSSEDYLDCFEKLLRLNLKDKQAREIIHVLIECCLQEKSHNPFYSFLAQKLCEFSRANQVTFQYSFWDRFKNISSMKKQNCENMAKLLAHLLASNAISLSVLKVVGFATMDKPSIDFFIQLFTILMQNYPNSVIKSVFSRICNLDKLSLLREGLKVFLRHFLLPRADVSTQKLRKDSKLREQVEIAEAALDGREVIKF